MLLHHFTSRDALSPILQQGLLPGAVAVSATRAVQAVWLTADPGSNGHGLDSGGAVMTDEERYRAYEWSGAWPPPGARFPKDSSVRISIDFAAADRNLHEWLPWARRNLAPDRLAELHPVGSDLRKARSWRLYTGAISPESFVEVAGGEVARFAHAGGR